MSANLLFWDIYSIETRKTSLIGVSLRGRIRKFALQNSINLIVENAEDKENCVRFAVTVGEEVASVKQFIETLAADVSVKLEKPGIANPVLSKLSVNNESKYDID